MEEQPTHLLKQHPLPWLHLFMINAPEAVAPSSINGTLAVQSV